MKRPRLELHPDLFDAMELSALVFGGIGKETWSADGNFSRFDLAAGLGEPCCGIGHACFIEGAVHQGLIHTALGGFVFVGDNDEAVGTAKRISFKTWCERLNIHRAEIDTFDPANFPLIN